MSVIIRAAFVALLLAGATSAQAGSAGNGWTDNSDRYGGYHPKSQEGIRAFWEDMTRRGGR
ncbi:MULTISPECIES: hypothetical protein [Rhodomicrobium]|uniref:hypothetical protein n=1 Tax=Rhodomicrobium TaxID=1068 RepID=UPI000F740DCC|nr:MULTISPECIES: hypothetical protein [Rhodomicrobium]